MEIALYICSTKIKNAISWGNVKFDNDSFILDLFLIILLWPSAGPSKKTISLL